MNERRQEIIEELRNDLILFGRVISPSTFFRPSPQFHYEIANLFMDRDFPQVCVQAPRGFAKSSIAMMFVLHHIIFDEGNKLVVIQSKNRPEAINRLDKIKDILSGMTKGGWVGLAGQYYNKKNSLIWREDKIKFKLFGNTVTVKAVGTGQQIRGLLEDDTRTTLLLLDDPEDELNTKTETAMESNFDIFYSALPGLDSRNGRVIVIGTPIHERCIVERLKDLNNKGWVFRKYEAHDDNFENLLWSEFRDKKWLKEKYEEHAASNKLRKYYSEYRCSLIPGEEASFKQQDFRYWDGHLFIKNGEAFLNITHLHKVKLPEAMIVPVNTYIGIDPASSQSSSADYSVIMPIAYDSMDRIFVLPYYRKRTDPYDFANEIIKAYKRIRPEKIRIETTGYQQALYSFLQAKKKENNLRISIKGLKPRERKLGDGGRLESLIPLFREHRVYIQENMSELVGELLMYPRPKHDDLLDGLWYAQYRLIKPAHSYEELEYDDDEKMFVEGYRETKTKGNWRIA